LGKTSQIYVGVALRAPFHAPYSRDSKHAPRMQPMALGVQGGGYRHARPHCARRAPCKHGHALPPPPDTHGGQWWCERCCGGQRAAYRPQKGLGNPGKLRWFCAGRLCRPVLGEAVGILPEGAAIGMVGNVVRGLQSMQARA